MMIRELYHIAHSQRFLLALLGFLAAFVACLTARAQEAKPRLLFTFLTAELRDGQPWLELTDTLARAGAPRRLQPPRTDSDWLFVLRDGGGQAIDTIYQPEPFVRTLEHAHESGSLGHAPVDVRQASVTLRSAFHPGASQLDFYWNPDGSGYRRLQTLRFHPHSKH